MHCLWSPGTNVEHSVSSMFSLSGVDGDFDSCQSAIKAIFRSQSVNERLMDAYNIKLSAANSINWGRLLPQVVYHASAYLDLVRQGVIGMGDECDVCIPTGNFGNILAAFYARVNKLIQLNLPCTVDGGGD